MTTPASTLRLAPRADGWRWAPAWILLFVALWPAPGYAEAVLALGALAALVQLALHRFRGGDRLLSNEAWALTSVMFCAYWVPEFISAFDAVDHGRAWGEAATDLRYLPFLWLVASAVANERGRRITFGGLAIIVAIWTLDALVQVAVGTSPLFFGIDALKQAFSGHPMCSAAEVEAVDRLSGFLGPCNLKLGLVLASLSPFGLFAAGRRFGMGGWLLAAAAIGVVVLLAGARAAWITYALVLVFSGWRLLGWKPLLGVFATAAVLLAVMAVASPKLAKRVQLTTAAFAGDEAGVDTALSGRGRIWQAAGCMIGEHPINGVGVRNFRDVFPACDPTPSVAPAWGHGPALHAHQIVLEILAETGVIGLLLWLSGAALAWRAWRFATPEARDRARPAMLALAVTVFPLNTHLAFYSTFWGGLTLLLTALYAGSLLARHDAAAA
ncbi:O-antigen ligase family protein [Pseudoxanthomonas winnipegensis]|uniref:O-antigen ligase family protein n=1 Tax=Pseudoxanthomonas winnipegensis TaxID=2480810 RepID=A0A4Q8LL68_9GAMM|nr:O-antigen ligase [Pseudoxanthomonas winnipegensis]RZZ86148.1 O-antigen ligase family protein [Pseudoxanthomonas winnipegensis]TAA31285.1 O-antigen ligase family protein [Pseudoxanthomonas winnipegensis]TBV77411.1 O-antigen ligase family protein [Pseudoxanthomonas winnipegensis]